MEPQLKTNRKGLQYLEVFYTGSIADADRAIEKAIIETGLDRNEVTVLAYPVSMKNYQPNQAASHA